MQEEVSMIRGPPLYLPLTEAQTNRRSEKGERRMAKKTSNLKIVEQQTKAEWQAKYEREKVAKELKEEEESWRLTRPEITARVRALRAELDSFRAQLEGMPFDVVTSEYRCPSIMETDRTLQNLERRLIPPLKAITTALRKRLHTISRTI